MAHNPVQIILNAQDYVRKADVNPGGTIKDFYAGRNADFVAHRNAVEAQVLGLRDAYHGALPDDVFYAFVELQTDAWAKSHRPIQKVFPPGQQVYVGGGKLGSMVVELTAADIPRIAATIASAENEVINVVNKKGELKPKPTRVRANRPVTSLNEQVAQYGDVPPGDGSASDPLYDMAVALVRSSQRTSISLIQRHLRIGYNRAARLLDAIEAAGVVSTEEGCGS